MPRYKVSYWDIIDANDEEEAKQTFLALMNDDSIDVEEIDE